jgi:predicted ATP-grasp superfamily ATP-dependent carboligase
MTKYRLFAGSPTTLDVLVLGASPRQGLAAIRALGRDGLKVGAAECTTEGRVPAFTSRWCTLAAALPDVTVDQDRYVDALLDLLKDYPSTVLLPASDEMLNILNTRREDLECHAALAVPREPALSLLNDKELTLGLARQLGIPVPEGVMVSHLDEVAGAARAVGFPAVVKPAESWPRSSLDRPLKTVRLNCHDVRNVHELHAEVETMLAAGGRPIVQPWLPGAREAVSLFMVNGRVHARFAQLAHRMMPPLGGSSIYRESIPPPPDATAAAEALARAAGLEGYAEVEFRRDGAGHAVLMEVNPRLSASVEVAIRAGVNFPRLAVAQAVGDPLPSVTGYQLGVRMRWLGGDLRWLSRSVADRGRTDVPSPGRALWEVARSSLHHTGYDYVDPLDLRPAVLAAQRYVREAATVIRSRIAVRKTRIAAR